MFVLKGCKLKGNLVLIFLFCSIGISLSAQKGNEWITNENPMLVDSTSAKSHMEFENTPESIVNYFYASKIRNDSLWKKVLQPEDQQNSRLKVKLDKYKKWKFHQIKILRKIEHKENAYWIKIFMEIEYKGKKNSGTDDVEVQKINGRWVITSVPT